MQLNILVPVWALLLMRHAQDVEKLMNNNLMVLGRGVLVLQMVLSTHYAAGLVKVDIMLAMTRKVPVIGITARVLGEDVEEVMLYSPGYEPGKQVMMVVGGRV